MPENDKTRGAARVALHRFSDCAALSILKAKGTVYLDAKAARDLARDLNRLARSIKAEAFVDHTFKPGPDLPAFESSYHIPATKKRAIGRPGGNMTAAESFYESSRGLSAFNVTGAIRRRLNQFAIRYTFPDSSFLIILQSRNSIAWGPDVATGNQFAIRGLF